MSNRRVNEALAVVAETTASSNDEAFPGNTSGARALAVELESLAQDIAATPGAGGALLASFAEQTRVLQLVAQASMRAPGLPLPHDVLEAVQAAVHGAVVGSPGFL